MPYTVQHTLPTYAEVFTRLPLSDNIAKKITQDRKEVEDILIGKNPRKLLIIGPCSAWPSESVVEYAKKLAPLAEEISDVVKVVMRSYIQKPRTTVGWMGPLMQPNPYTDPHVPKGVFYCRKMMLDILALGLPIADEILFPRCQSYFRDLLSWAAIGARSSENQEHRVLASLLDFPIGVKNPTSGNISIAANSVLACQAPNYLAVDGNQVQTSGNPYAHLVLRGGNGKPNISEEHLVKAVDMLAQKNIQNPSIMVDVSHDNTCDENGKKQYQRQTGILWETLAISQKNPAINEIVKGWMLESFLETGAQKIDEQNPEKLTPGQSITDGCLGWEETESLLTELANTLRKNS